MAGDQLSIAVADASVVPVPPIGATARTGVPIGDAAIAAIIAIVVIAVVVIWETAPDEEWKTEEIAMEVMEATVMKIAEVGMAPSHWTELPARDSHPELSEARISTHHKPAPAESTH